MVTKQQQFAIFSKITTRRLLARSGNLDILNLRGKGLLEGCELVAEHLSSSGAKPAELRTYAGGAENRYYSWSREQRPLVEEAELWLQEPEGREVLICRSTETATCSMGAFRSTRDEGEILEVVDVGAGTQPRDFRGTRMAGKVALVSGHHLQAAILEGLVNRQAAGLIAGPGIEGRDQDRIIHHRLDHPSIFGKQRPFGFNLSRSQYHQLLQRLSTGEPVKVRVVINVSLDPGLLPVVSATLPGSNLAAERILLTAELSPEQGSMGSACLQEIFHAIGSLVVEGKVPPLRRSLQVLVNTGPQSVVAWLEDNQEQLHQIKGVIHLVAREDRAPGRVWVQAPPPPRLSMLPDLLLDHLNLAAAAQVTLHGIAPLEVQIPSSADLSTSPLYNGDTALDGVTVQWSRGDRRRRDGGRTVGSVARFAAGISGAALDLCCLQDNDIPRLMSGSHFRGLARLIRRAQSLRDVIQQTLHQDRSTSTTGRHLLWRCEAAMGEGLRREQEVLRRCAEFPSAPRRHALALAEASVELEQVATSLMRSLQQDVASLLPARAHLEVRRQPLSALERRAQKIRIHRAFAGPLPTPRLMPEATPADRGWLAGSAGALADNPPGECILQWVDSRLSLLELYDRLSWDHPRVDLKTIWRYLEVLQGAGLVRLEEQSTTAAPDDGDGASESGQVSADLQAELE